MTSSRCCSHQRAVAAASSGSPSSADVGAIGTRALLTHLHGRVGQQRRQRGLGDRPGDVGQAHRGAVEGHHRVHRPGPAHVSPGRSTGCRALTPPHRPQRRALRAPGGRRCGVQTVEVAPSNVLVRSASSSRCHNMPNSTGSTATGSPTARGPGQQRGRVGEHLPQQAIRVARLRAARMPVAGQPPQIRRRHRVQLADPLVVPADLARRSAVAVNTAACPSVIRSSGRTSITIPVPSARRAKKSGACRTRPPGLPVDPMQPHRLGRDRHHIRVGVQRHQRRRARPTTRSPRAHRCARTTTAPASCAVPDTTGTPAPARPARTARRQQRPSGSRRAPVDADELHLTTPPPPIMSTSIWLNLDRKAQPTARDTPYLAQLQSEPRPPGSAPIATAHFHRDRTTEAVNRSRSRAATAMPHSQPRDQECLKLAGMNRPPASETPAMPQIIWHRTTAPTTPININNDTTSTSQRPTA